MAKAGRGMEMHAFDDPLSCETLLFYFITMWASAPENISTHLASLTIKRMFLERCTHAHSALQSCRLSEFAFVLHESTLDFIQAAGVADVLQVLSRRILSCDFLLQSNCADIKLKNELLHNLIWEFLQVSETTTARAENKCHNAGPHFFWEKEVGKIRRRGHSQFRCMTM